jgi:hypothetical protein
VALTVLPSAAVAAVIFALTVEVHSWRRGTSPATKRQRIFRVIEAILLESVLLMVLFGRSMPAKSNPLFQIYFWGTAFMLAVILVAVAMLDVREGLVVFRESRREAFRGLFEEKWQDK